jgi:C4-dicarboxylate transporter
MAEKKDVSKQFPKPVNWKHQKRRIILNNEVSKFTKAFRENFITLIVSALGLVAALSWNDAIKTAIATLFPSESDLIYKFYVAVTVTIMAVVITYFLSRIKTNGKS